MRGQDKFMLKTGGDYLKIINFAKNPVPRVYCIMRMTTRRLLIVLLLALLSIAVNGQKVWRNNSILNYQKGDRRLLQFGFTLGLNYMDYRVLLAEGQPYRAESGKLHAGYTIGIISELNICPELGLRFLPGLEFATRSVVFPQLEEKYAYNNVVYTTLPLMLKLKANRIGNFRPYVTAGSSIKFDFQGHKHLDPGGKVYFRTKPYEIFLETGVGVDFYLPYFRLGMELRFALGMTDVLVHKNDPDNPGYEAYTSAIKKLNSRMFSVCFNFE